MPSIANGGNATGTLGLQDSVSVDAGGGFARFECPVGTIVSEFRGSRTFGPYDSLSYKITSLQGAIYYEVADGTRIVPAYVDSNTGLFYSDSRGQSTVSGAGNRRPSAGTLLTDWGAAGSLSTTGSTGTGPTFALDTGKTLFGKPTVKATFQSDGTSQTFIGAWTPTNAISAANINTVQVPFFATAMNGSNIDWTNTKLWIQTSDSKSVRLLLEGIPSGFQSGVWNTLSFSRGGATVTQDLMTALDTPGVTISKIQLVAVTTGNASASPLWLGEIRADIKAAPGSVVIRMDGEKGSQYTRGFPILSSYGLPCTLALTGSEIGTANFMTWAQIKQMYDTLSGDCILHTWDSTKQNGYVNSADWPTAAAISADRRAGSAAIRAQGMTRGDGGGGWGYAETFGGSQTAARQQLVRDGLVGGGTWAMCKGLPYDGDVGGVLLPQYRVPVDPLVIYGAVQVNNTHTLPQLTAIVDAAEARGEAAIFTFHHIIGDGDTLGATGTNLEIRETNFRSLMAYIATRRAASGITVKTFSDLVAGMTAAGQF